MNLLKIIALLIAFIFWQNTSSAEENAVWQGSAEKEFFARVQLSSTRLALSDYLTILVELHYPPTHSPDVKLMRENLLDYDGPNLAPFSLIKETITPPETQSDGSLKQGIEWVLSPQITGDFSLTLQKIIFESKENNSNQVSLISNIFEISIFSSPTHFEPSQYMAPLLRLTREIPITISEENRQKFLTNPALHDQEISRSLSVIQSKAIPWEIILALIVLTLVYCLIRVFPPADLIRIKKPPPLPPDQQALQQLNFLKNQLSDKDKYIPYFANLDYVVRRYFTDAYGLDALSYTSQEFLSQAQTVPQLNEKSLTKLNLFLKLTEQVKYAHHSPSPQECQEALDIAQQLIRR